MTLLGRSLPPAIARLNGRSRHGGRRYAEYDVDSRLAASAALSSASLPGWPLDHRLGDALASLGMTRG